jgi:hypothetical protein
MVKKEPKSKALKKMIGDKPQIDLLSDRLLDYIDVYKASKEFHKNCP